MSEPEDPVLRAALDRALTGGPLLVKVDRYGSVSGLFRVRVPLGELVIIRERPIESEDPYGS